ncbi:hypothetical protein TWF173_002915 [Orbilia oligospora]|uniref:Uncharacterized protein n=1 Tax=Arthrobotrys oligospora (strain ATCC 24927 / CBS 115.81 / DSM 1491) TaxID=756982 RepID=G1X6K0_ARTOA|nr:hypothetical protein AOL_s00054g494 [Orbilia oligospora ATCC 24927]EGX51225.1 hypothetical protein AOL_s00054g494 [Orbilia oligospora ATCC 24927]KAF3307528.1 hypothetical protein TWF173_002915 [Orbilia oligospora]
MGGEEHDRPSAFNISQLPSEVADELAAFLRSHTARSHDTFYTNKLSSYTTANTVYKDDLQDIQSQVSNVIEPTAEVLIPVAVELKHTFEQIDRLEHLLTQVIAPQIKDLSTKLDKTEQLVRSEERNISQGRRVDLWKGVDMGDKSLRRVFRTSDYFDEDGKLKDPPI